MCGPYRGPFLLLKLSFLHDYSDKGREKLVHAKSAFSTSARHELEHFERRDMQVNEVARQSLNSTLGYLNPKPDTPKT